MHKALPLTLVDLENSVAAGQIDTVLVVFPDLQGRPVGKRVVAPFFLDHVAKHGVEACDYLLAVDVDMNPIPGYRFTNWETGYGDLNARCDISTLRLVPWLEKTALVICDVFKMDGSEIDIAPRTLLRNQIKKAHGLGYEIKTGTELEFFLFKDTYIDAADKNYKDLRTFSNGVEDYQIFQTSVEEPIIREIRNNLLLAGIPIEFSKGEAGNGQHEINVTYDLALNCADNHMIFKNGVREICALKSVSATFMAKWSMEEVGSSCHVHSSVWDLKSSQSLMYDEGETYTLSKLAKSYIAGQLALARELSWFYAHYLNSFRRYVPGSWAPTAVAWGIDNRTCGFRVVGKNSGIRVENRIPGADVNPYLTLGATIAAGLYGIEKNLELPPPLAGNGYTAEGVDRIPNTLNEAVELLESSEIVKTIFGEEVHYHYLNTAKQEFQASNRVVTDWELKRNFERI